MKLSSALLASLIVAIQHRGHHTCASADGHHERKLLINQADAAKNVNDAVELAMASIDAGDVHGTVLPLNYVLLSGNQGSEQQLTVALRLPGVNSRDQNVMIDTGSSSLAFCNKSVIEEAVNITPTDYAQCRMYGFHTYCPNSPDANNLFDSFYVGQVLQGNIAAYNINTGKEIASMDEVYFGIISEVQNYMCLGPLNGIIGVAYTALNTVVKTSSPEFNVLNLWKQSCENVDDPYYESIGTCNTGNLPVVTLPSPLEQTLQEKVESGHESVESFGLYCDYAATIGSTTDTIVPSLGIYFGGNVALNNTFYNSGTPQITTSPKCENESFWYTLNLNAITVPGLNKSQSGFSQCKDVCAGSCFTDSGTSFISLPLPENDCNDIKSMDDNNLKELGSLLIDLEGVHDSTVTLSLPLLWVSEQIVLGNFICSGTSGKFILGFPIFQYYYLVYNMGDKTVTFVDLQLSNETKAFVYGPELGGTNKPRSGYLRSTSSLMTIGIGCLLLAIQ